MKQKKRENRVNTGVFTLFYIPLSYLYFRQLPIAENRSKSTDKLRNNICVKNIRERQDARGYILLAPLCSKGDWNEHLTVLLRLIESIRELPYIDKTRVHITGNSMGGYGTWEICLLRHDWFASAMPLCGGGIGAFAKRLVDLPIRAFHGLRDKVVDPIESLQMVKAVNNAGGHAELILFPQLEHNCWSTVYSDERNYDWLLAFSTERDKTLIEELAGDYYG